MASTSRRELQKKFCKCPKQIQKLCRKKAIESGQDVLEILEALDYEEQLAKGACLSLPKFKVKKYKPPHYKDTCVPMTPSMHTRLRYIGHCPDEPPDDLRRRTKMYESMGYVESEDDLDTNLRRAKKKDKKRVRIRKKPDPCHCAVIMDRPQKVVKHTESDKSMISVASPKLSGTNIAPQRTAVEPFTAHRPPLPSKAAIALIRPQSGIVLNQNADYDPVMDVLEGPPMSGEGKEKKQPPCLGGGICNHKHCKRKACRKRAKMLRQKKKKSQMGVGGKRRKRRYVSNDDDVCGLDDIPRPDHVSVPANLKKGMFETHSFTVLPCNKDRTSDIHYGILAGSCNMYDNRFGPRSRGRQALAMSVMAYCLAFHYHPKQWTAKLVDNLVYAGDQWYLQCAEKVHDHSAYMGICEVLPFGKKQVLTLNRKRMQVLLCEPDIIGYALSKDPAVYNLCKGLKAFFKDNRAGVLMTRILKVSIWKDKICYYIFDAAGRNSKAISDFANGRAAIINVKDLQGVVEILLGRSIVDDQKFVLAPIKVIKMIDEKIDDDLISEPEPTQTEKAMMGYKILNENSAIVNANMHLGDRCFETAKFRQALPIAVIAMTYAKISPPNTWYTKTLDKILRLGNKLYKDCHYNRVLIDLTIDNIPNEIAMGPYTCEIIIYRERIKGQLFTTRECIMDINRGLEDFFDQDYSSGILDFNNYVLAIWKQKDMFYLFDPYPRTATGLRSLKGGKACCFMLLNIEAIAEVIRQNWDYLPNSTQYYIHAFKVLKLKKKKTKDDIVCILSDSMLPGSRSRRSILSDAQGDGINRGGIIEVMPAGREVSGKTSWSTVGPDGAAGKVLRDEEQMGDITSLVDSIQEDFVPKIPLKYKNMPDETEVKIANLDSPTVSVTQVVPAWPKPRDKTGEIPDEDPSPEPTPPPTPPPPPPPEGAEEEAVEEELDEETMKLKKEEEALRKAMEEEERRKLEELPPEMPPPPPSPAPDFDAEVPLAQPDDAPMGEMETLEPEDVERHILLAADAKYRSKLRQMRQKMSAPLVDVSPVEPVERELEKPNNFLMLFNNVGIIRGKVGKFAGPDKQIDFMPFASIMAIVLSYKYSINSWSKGIVQYAIDTAGKLYDKRKARFQMCPAHVIPKIKIGTQAFSANIDVVAEGPTWLLTDIISNKFLNKYDRGMITTATYSGAFFAKNGLYYLFEGKECDPLGYRHGIINADGKKGAACLLRFRKLDDLVDRVNYNKNATVDDQEFILSRIIVRKLLVEPRYQLTEDHDFATGAPSSVKSKQKATEKIPTSIALPEVPDEDLPVGYQPVDGVYRIEGTTVLKGKGTSTDIKPCHFVSVIAMLMATMHPIRTWNRMMVDLCLEKGLEIGDKAKNMEVCEKRIIRNIILDGKFCDLTIKKIIVVNENPDQKLIQYMKAVLRRLRFVLIRFPEASMTVVRADGFYHLFDPYPPPTNETLPGDNKVNPAAKKGNAVASWTLYRYIDDLVQRITKSGVTHKSPEFYTFELTSMRSAPRHAALNYRLSPLFKPDENPNTPYLKRRKVYPIVDEKMYWLDIDYIPWSRMNPYNDMGLLRNRLQTLWRAWDIEFPGDLYSVWGTIHPTDPRFADENRGKQYLATSVVALALSRVCQLEAYNSTLLDGIVEQGDLYHTACCASLGVNHELQITDLVSEFSGMHPYAFKLKFKECVFGFVYNMYPDRFNLSKALVYFFESNRIGILMSPTKNLAFGRGKDSASYFMFDCQSFGSPIFNPGKGAAYMLKCESLNRLVYCMTITLNIKKHGGQFHLYSVHGEIKEK